MLELTRPVVSTDRLVPAPPWEGGERTASLLGPNWRRGGTPDGEEPVEGGGSEDEGPYRIRGMLAEFSFDTVLDGDHTLELEIRPQQGERVERQRLVVELNGQEIGERRLRPRWEIEEVVLPGHLLRAGRNLAALRFAYAEPASQAGADSPPIAARVRSLRVVSPQQRPRWLQRPEDVASTAGSNGGALEMPADSFVDLALRVPPQARFAVELTATRNRGTLMDSSDLQANVELVAQGSTETHRLATVAVPAGQRVRLDTDLASWGGQLVRLRLTSWGAANGTVRWDRPRVVHRGAIEERGAPIQLAPAASQSRGQLGRPHVLLILLDAARADAFSVYGAPTSTPATERLARTGTVFERALAPTAWTGASVPSLLTGLLPGTHSVQVWNTPLAQEIPSIAELLSDAGYRTALFSHHLIYRGNRSLRRGFEDIELVSHHERQLLPDLGELFGGDRPTFAFVHLLVPHAPYEPPVQFRGQAAAADTHLTDADITPQVLGQLRASQLTPSDEYLAFLRARYAEMVAWADSEIAQLLDGLDAAGVFNDSLVILTSDHGEGLFEHGHVLHTRFLYDEGIRVPLVIKWPASVAGFAPSVQQTVGLIDITPTLVDGLMLDSGSALFQGQSLLQAADVGPAPETVSTAGNRANPDRAATRPAFAVTRRAERDGQAARPLLAYEEGGLKLIYDVEANRIELFRIAADPGELHNLAYSEPVEAQWLLQRALSQWHYNRALGGDPEALELDADTLRDLRALGYLQ